MADEEKRAEDFEKFMSMLTDVKVSQAETNGKLDNLLDMKEQVTANGKTATHADYRSQQNEEDIAAISNALNDKASKEDVGRIVKQRENSSRNIPAWVAIVVSSVTALVAIFTYLD